VTSALLALGASVSWGVADFLGGFFARRLHPLAVLLVVDIGGMLPVLPFALTRGTDGLTGTVALLSAAGAVSGGIGLLAFYRGMRIGAISIVAPITGLSATIPIVVGLATGDKPSAWQELGFALALAGVVLAAREHHPETGKLKVASGVGVALVALVCFGGYFVPIHAAAHRNAFWSLIAFRISAALFATLIVAARRPSLRMPPRWLALLCGAALLDLGGSLGYALASRHGLLSVVSVLGALYPVTTVALAMVVSRERIARLQLGGAFAALCGVALIVGG
jgi:drug/metabolite transporter (DMT)-like permease